ncbi:MAG: hypothetical protein ACFFG0_23585 [Candidatus Thorarchaeota archaeon]
MNLFNIGLKLIDIFKGTSILNYLNFLNESIKWEKKEIERYQMKKLSKLLHHSYENIPYYREIFDKNKIGYDSIYSISDLKKIPVLTRIDIQKNLDKLVVRKIKKFKSSSSGTTGIPINFYNDLDSQSAGAASGLFCYQLSGWKPGSKMLHIWGNELSIKRWNTLASKMKRLFMRQKNLPSTFFNKQENFPEIIKLINKYKPVSIDGYTSSIYNLSLFIIKTNINVHSPDFVFTTAENLFEYQKEIIEDSLAKVSDIYGCGEINGIAVCPINSKKYYIIEPHVIVETEESNEEMNDIIVTDLDNMIMPFIRYKIGDLIDNVCKNDGDDKIKFDYFKRIIGRSSEVIELRNGDRISPVNIIGGTLLREIGGVLKHKVVWNGEYLELLLETNKDFKLEYAKRVINEKFKKYGIEVRLNLVGELKPCENGKFKFFENRV